MIFEDPNGTRLLYDAGRTVRGSKDSRLGKIDVVLLSHVHGDHLGDSYQPAADAGTCKNPDFTVSALPHSNSLEIAAEKKSVFIAGGESASFFKIKMKKLKGGDPDKIRLLRFGAEYVHNGVSIISVPAVHSNGLNPAFMDGESAKHLKDNGLTAYVGPPGGFVLIFTNGLSVYLSGDTGITAEQETVVRKYYRVKTAVMNIGGTFTTGPVEAAHVMNRLVKPKSVIVSHSNEQSTVNGKIQPGSKAEKFIKKVKAPVYVPLSEIQMELNGTGRCVKGCAAY